MISVKRYDENFKDQWNELIYKSKNGSFLFNRDFLEYHSNRFEDFSLLIFFNNNLISVLPANIVENTLYSHQGLSYGGFVLLNDLKLNTIKDIVKESLIFLEKNNIDKIYIKFIPKMYHSQPSDELDWVMFKLKAELYRRDTALVINKKSLRLNYQERRIRSINQVDPNKVCIKEGKLEFEPFWNKILIPNLELKHGVKPVHSLSEILLLSNLFPKNIKQYNIYIENKIVAGCTIFQYNKVVHCQYISGSLIGRDSGCLDYLFNYLINDNFFEFDYFDFGICNENEGKDLNFGLLDWKEGFGARTISHDFYKVNSSNYFLLD